MATFSLNSWTTGDYLTQTKLRQHNDNEEYLQERTDYRTLRVPDSIVAATGSVTVDILIDGSSVGNVVVGENSDFTIRNKSTAGYSAGMHTVGVEGNEVEFYLPQDHDFISASGHRSNWEDDDEILRSILENVTIITHRESYSW